MKKKLIIINGTMGVGKTETCRELNKFLNNSVWLDGDWCWRMNPFIVNEENKDMVINNITYLLRSFLTNSSLEHVIFNWVIHTEDIFISGSRIIMFRFNAKVAKWFFEPQNYVIEKDRGEIITDPNTDFFR